MDKDLQEQLKKLVFTDKAEELADQIAEFLTPINPNLATAMGAYGCLIGGVLFDSAREFGLGETAKVFGEWAVMVMRAVLYKVASEGEA